jgi:hypothetical protein
VTREARQGWFLIRNLETYVFGTTPSALSNVASGLAEGKPHFEHIPSPKISFSLAEPISI